jgi:hypothetical protein
LELSAVFQTLIDLIKPVRLDSLVVIKTSVYALAGAHGYVKLVYVPMAEELRLAQTRDAVEVLQYFLFSRPELYCSHERLCVQAVLWHFRSLGYAVREMTLHCGRGKSINYDLTCPQSAFSK